MKPRHIVAVALIGWYLMVPPKGCTGRIHMDAPISSWSTVTSFDSLDDCKTAGLAASQVKDSDVAVTLKGLSKTYPYIAEAWDQLRAGAWLCTASDDPRLKEKCAKAEDMGLRLR
jgi:hypothetical protein